MAIEILDFAGTVELECITLDSEFRCGYFEWVPGMKEELEKSGAVTQREYILMWEWGPSNNVNTGIVIWSLCCRWLILPDHERRRTLPRLPTKCFRRWIEI
jgi:hypothetical protein